MESVWPVSKLSIESVGSRRELVANSCTHRRRRRDATKQFRQVGVGGVYWALTSGLETTTGSRRNAELSDGTLVTLFRQ